MRTEKYGPEPSQEGDLFLPHRARPPVVTLLHGGFWRMPHGREQMTAIARDLVERGFAVWNLEYRRLGEVSAGWPATFDDVSAGIDHLAAMVDRGIDLDLDRVAVVGHSAGGHLALWAAAKRGSVEKRSVRIRAAVAQAPVADLVRAWELRVGGSVVSELLGGTPAQTSDRYRAASPYSLVPLGVRQLILHGTADDVVPAEISQRYAAAARGAGDDVELRLLDGAGHMDFLDPRSAAHDAACEWLK